MCREIQAEVGTFQTVFGVKRDSGRCSWELYFYDYRRYDRHVPANRVLAIVERHLGTTPTIDEARPYFMFSFEFTAESFRSRPGLREVDIYVGTEGDGISSGLCYAVGADGPKLKNTYHFYDAKRQRNRAWARFAESVRIDGRSLDPNRVHWPLTHRCTTVVVANKQYRDGLYFTHLDIDHFLAFITETDPADPLIDFVRSHRGQLDHLRYDVGLDLVPDESGPRVSRSAYYGNL